jgi:hypothetical protein
VVLATTGIVVLLTILIFGGLTEPAIKHFKIQREEAFHANIFDEVKYCIASMVVLQFLCKGSWIDIPAKVCYQLSSRF